MSANQPTVDELIHMLHQSTEHLVKMAERLEFPWNPNLEDPRGLHNMYPRNLITSYVSRFADLSKGIIVAIEQSNFLMYALCGRALIETTAILRFYMVEHYKPLLDKGILSNGDLARLVEIDDRHLRGGKFDWESFLFKRYSKLRTDAVTRMANKGKKQTSPPSGDSLPRQVRIGSCVESWAREM